MSEENKVEDQTTETPTDTGGEEVVIDESGKIVEEKPNDGNNESGTPPNNDGGGEDGSTGGNDEGTGSSEDSQSAFATTSQEGKDTEPKEPDVKSIVEEAVKENLKPLISDREKADKQAELDKKKSSIVKEAQEAYDVMKEAEEGSATYQYARRNYEEAVRKAQEVKKEEDELNQTPTETPDEQKPADDKYNQFKTPEAEANYANWTKVNDWYQKTGFEAETISANDYADKLIASGYNPKDKSFFDAITAHLKKAFPERANKADSKKVGNNQIEEPAFTENSAGSNSGATPTGGNKSGKRTTIRIPESAKQRAIQRYGSWERTPKEFKESLVKVLHKKQQANK